MNEYTGKICPYCKTPLRPQDDIVVCSQCDMPHHKDCWVENQGCTTFGCTGTIKSAEGGATSVTATQLRYEDPQPAAATGNRFCPRCGTPNESAAAFCAQCGNRLAAVPAPAPAAPAYTPASPYQQSPYQQQSYQQQSPYQQSPYQSYQQNPYQQTTLDPILPRLVDTKSEYYIPKFRELKTQNKSTSWNWPAFLVAPYWLIYRKMYGFGAALVAADLFISLIGSPALSALALIGYIVMGVLGNSIYLKHLEGKAAQANAMQEPFKSQFIATNGGVNSTATALTVIGRALLVGILMSL